jgi:hypothetical protein
MHPPTSARLSFRADGEDVPAERGPRDEATSLRPPKHVPEARQIPIHRRRFPMAEGPSEIFNRCWPLKCRQRQVAQMLTQNLELTRGGRVAL